MAGKLNVAGKLNRTPPQGGGVKVGVEGIHFCGAGAKKLDEVILTVYQAWPEN